MLDDHNSISFQWHFCLISARYRYLLPAGQDTQNRTVRAVQPMYGSACTGLLHRSAWKVSPDNTKCKRKVFTQPMKRSMLSSSQMTNPHVNDSVFTQPDDNVHVIIQPDDNRKCKEKVIIKPWIIKISVSVSVIQPDYNIKCHDPSRRKYSYYHLKIYSGMITLMLSSG